MGQYLDEKQIFEEVVSQDAEVLKSAGVTYQQIGDALERVLKSYNWEKSRSSKVDPSISLTQQVNNTLSISAIQHKGYEICPFDESLKASKIYFIFGIPNGNKAGRSWSPDNSTLVTEMMPDLIRNHHFFEGDVPHGIKPEWAILIYQIVEKEGILKV